ncbi:uncharacterized protein [Nicotiana sylvestris]|uniref:uncharacterized protein n=1 Tax=Nicotiana sylvestris TaxID=4096 RepID=UPI00388C9958
MDKRVQEAFDKIKEYLSNPPVLVPPEPGKSLFLYLTVLENSFGCVLGQHDVTGKRERASYYLSKKFTSYEAKYTLLERTCYALTWVAQKLRHYLQAYTTYLKTRLDPLKYIFQKTIPTGRLAKWQILLTKFDIVYVTRTAMKAQALADHLAENPVNDEYQPLNTYFPDEEVNSVEAIFEDTNAWKMFFDVTVNAKGDGIGEILISPTGQHYPTITRLRFFYINNTAEYEAYNAANLNSHLMGEICEQFKITHQNSTPYRPKANGAVEAANKNIKKILRKMIQSSRQWHEKLPFALFRYRTTMHTSVGATPYLLVYGTKVVIPAEVEVPTLQIIVEAEIEDSEWVKARLEQLTLIDEKQMAAVCHGQLYQQRMDRAYNKKEAKGKFAPNWKGPYIIRKILPRGALYLGDIEGNDPEAAVNADAVKRKGGKIGFTGFCLTKAKEKYPASAGASSRSRLAMMADALKSKLLKGKESQRQKP